MIQLSPLAAAQASGGGGLALVRLLVPIVFEPLFHGRSMLVPCQPPPSRDRWAPWAPGRRQAGDEAGEMIQDDEEDLEEDLPRKAEPDPGDPAPPAVRCGHRIATHHLHAGLGQAIGRCPI